MFLFQVKLLIWSALEIKFFELYFLHPVLGGHLGWSLNTGRLYPVEDNTLNYYPV